MHCPNASSYYYFFIFCYRLIQRQLLQLHSMTSRLSRDSWSCMNSPTLIIILRGVHVHSKALPPVLRSRYRTYSLLLSVVLVPTP